MFRLLIATVATIVMTGIARADQELDVAIIGVKESDVTYKKVLGDNKFDEPKTAYTYRPIIQWGKVTADKKIAVDDKSVPTSLSNPFFKKASAKEPISARIFIDDQKASKTFGVIRRIVITQTIPADFKPDATPDAPLELKLDPIKKDEPKAAPLSVDRALAMLKFLGATIDREPIFQVELRGQNVTDEDLTPLASLKDLEVLILDRTSATDAGLKHLSHLTKLRDLQLAGSKITDVGLKDLRGLSNLRQLSLTRTNITDAGMKDLQPLKNLKFLHLGETKLTDAGLKELTALPHLERVVVTGTQVTDSGVAEFRKARPKCAITN